MTKKAIVTLFLLFFTNLTVMADCVTGYACSLKDLEKENYQYQKENTVTQNERHPNKQIDKQKEKKQGLFVDGKDKNSPKYTEMFTLRGFLP